MMPRRSRSSVALQLALALLVLLSTACGGGTTTPTPMPSSLRLTAVTPTSGSTSGGTTITLTGTNFGADAGVTIGGVPATAVAVVGPSTITATVPARTAGAATVVVTSGGNSASLANAFTYVAPSGANQAPVITGIRSVGSRPRQPENFGDVGENITLIATIMDNESAVNQLTYQWTGPGTFSQQAATTTWQPPPTFSPTPSQVTITLTATETFIEAGVTHQNVSTPGTYVLNLHNSEKEIMDLGEDFLTLFSQSSIPTDTVLRGFSPTCDGGAGRDAERGDVDRARRQYTQDFSKFRISRIPPVGYNFRGSCNVPGRNPQRNVDACAAFNVHWEVNYIQDVDGKKVGTREVTDGVDYVSAVLENNQWRLCHSDFIGSSFIPTMNLRRFVSW